MKAINLPRHERSFFQTGVDVNGKLHLLSPFTVTVPGTAEAVDMVRCLPASGDTSFFYQEESAKQRIVLHYTAGYLKGDIATLTTPGHHVSTPFVLARDGRIYNLWPSKYWSYHLGRGARGGNKAMSRSGVGIEISNVGWLARKGEELHTCYSKPSKPDVYCTVADTALYTQIPSYRGQRYFATYTDEQYRSIIQLLRFLTARYSIPREFLAPERRYGVVSDIAAFRGITSHVNYRADGKWDIGPAFQWDRVIAGVRGEEVQLPAGPLEPRVPAVDAPTSIRAAVIGVVTPTPTPPPVITAPAR